MFASENGHVSIVEILLRHNARVDIKNQVASVRLLTHLSIRDDCFTIAMYVFVLIYWPLCVLYRR